MKENIKRIFLSGEIELRSFGLLLAVFIPLLFGIFLPFIFEYKSPLLAWWVGWIFVVLVFFVPSFLKVLYIPWMILVELLGIVNNWLILSFIFYFIITPTALVVRWVFRRDSMDRKIDGSLLSYRKLFNNENSSMLNMY